MRPSEENRTLSETCLQERYEELRAKTLSAGLAAMRRRRHKRIAWKATTVLAIILGTMGVGRLIISDWPAGRDPASASVTGAAQIGEAEASGVGTLASDLHGPEVQILSDDELLKLFPGRAVALIGPPGKQVLYVGPPSTEPN